MKFQRCQRCQLCTMLGLLTPKSCYVRSAGQSYDDYVDSEPKILEVCPTCYDTPPGAISENVKHRRLPDAEYNQKS